MLVRDELIPIRAISAAAFRVSQEIRSSAGRVAGCSGGLTVSRSAPVNRSLFPAGTRFISQAALAAAFNESLGGGWRSFRRQVQLRRVGLLLGRIGDCRRPRRAGLYRIALRRSVRPGKLQLAASNRIGSAVVDHENDCQLDFMNGRRLSIGAGPRDEMNQRLVSTSARSSAG